jgi:homogentisate solanesyltransferase
VEKTYGDPFKTPLSVAADMRKELIEYLLRFTPSSSSNLASIASSHRAPLELAQDLLDAFILSKSSFFRRLSSKLLIGDEAKEDKIEDFLEELDFTETWICSHREQVAKMLLRKLDIERHGSICGMRFGSESELERHRLMCGLRPITCGNEGCGHILSAIHVPDHDRSCAYKLLSCEQKCGAMVIRSEMDKHCVTVCPMRPVKCSFSHVGCNVMVPIQNLERHCKESVDAHHALALKIAQQREMIASNLTQQILVLEKVSSSLIFFSFSLYDACSL